jgi:hemoglobin
MTPYETIGNEPALRAIVEDFINRVFEDRIIGFFFDKIDKATVIQRELELASKHLGGPHEYSGRPIGPVHRKHPINPGQFRRRLWLLEKTLQDHDVDEAIIESWLEHDRALEKAVVSADDCI